MEPTQESMAEKGTANQSGDERRRERPGQYEGAYAARLRLEVEPVLLQRPVTSTVLSFPYYIQSKLPFCSFCILSNPLWF